MSQIPKLSILCRKMTSGLDLHATTTSKNHWAFFISPARQRAAKTLLYIILLGSTFNANIVSTLKHHENSIADTFQAKVSE